MEQTITPETEEYIRTELKRIVTDLNLSDTQRDQARDAFQIASLSYQHSKKYGHVPTEKERNAMRVVIRERLVQFLTPEQLQKWDSGVAKAKEFLGQKLAA